MRSILAQTYADFEVIVIDDGSTDGTRLLVERLGADDPRVVLISEGRRGLVGALNRGIEVARGAFIARMDADDESLPERFARQVAFLGAQPECVAVGSRILKVDAEGVPRHKQPRVGRKRNAQWSVTCFPPQPPGLAHPTAMIRAEPLRGVGGYRAYFAHGGEDRDLWWRLAERGQLVELDDILLRYRVHAKSSSRSRRDRILLASLRADLSAVARHFGCDDGALLAATLDAHDAAPIVDGYERLLQGRYPVRDLALHFVIRERLWSLAGFKTRGEMLAHLASRLARRPAAMGSGALFRVALAQAFRAKREDGVADPGAT